MRGRGLLAGVLAAVCLWMGGSVGLALGFPDVPETAWYASYVTKAQSLGLMVGYDDGGFHPGDDITRAQFVQVLYNRYGHGADVTGGKFRDVPETAWYAKAVSWASGRDIVNGTGNGVFDPSGVLTREQMATILYAAAGRPQVDPNRQLARYLDYRDVSAWARDGLAWCVQYGVIQGTTGTALSPKGNTSRAEAATIMVRYITATTREE